MGFNSAFKGLNIRIKIYSA